MLILCMVTIGCSGTTTSTKEPSAEAKKLMLDTHLTMLSDEVVKAKLKAPATAVFPSADKYVIYDCDAVTEGFTGHTIMYYVDSENSFGAKIRSEVKVVIDISEDLKQYKVISCNIK